MTSAQKKRKPLSPLFKRVACQVGLKSSRPLSQVGPGSTRPGVFSEHSVTFMSMYMIYGLGFALSLGLNQR